jgi:hypothetical protein
MTKYKQNRQHQRTFVVIDVEIVRSREDGNERRKTRCLTLTVHAVAVIHTQRGFIIISQCVAIFCYFVSLSSDVPSVLGFVRSYN